MNRPVKFLLVDDLEENLLALEGLLRREGLELLKARSGAEALEILLVHDVALALIDVQMPEMDGFTLAELMRGTERTRYVPIIFVTAGMQDVQRRFRGYEVGAVDFLYKPIDPHILQSKAEVFWELARQRNQLQATTEALRIAQGELKQHAANLEATVAERTAKLRDSVAEMEHFSYTITHDMRAPLRSMQGFAELLTEQYCNQLDETGRDYLRRIMQAAVRMDRLITDALNYSKVMRTEFALEPIAPGPLLQGIVDSYPQFQSPAADIQLAENFPMVCANQAGLTQCFSNILSNAVKFVAPGIKPKVSVCSEIVNGMVRIWFQDNGIGIPSDQQERVFVMFQRLDKKFEGTGVGLALVRKVVHQMKGNVGFQSQPGQGTRFWIDLQPAKSVAWDRAGLDCQLIVVPDGQQAIDFINGKNTFADREQFPLPQLMLLDLNLPRCSGLEVLKSVRQKFDKTQLPIVVFSSSDSPKDKSATAEAGANGYIVKPTGLQQLVQVLNSIGAMIQSCQKSKKLTG